MRGRGRGDVTPSERQRRPSRRGPGPIVAVIGLSALTVFFAAPVVGSLGGWLFDPHGYTMLFLTPIALVLTVGLAIAWGWYEATGPNRRWRVRLVRSLCALLLLVTATTALAWLAHLGEDSPRFVGEGPVPTAFVDG